MKKIFIIKDKFEVKGKGIALTGITEDESLSLSKGDVAYIKQPNLPELEVEVLGFELMTNSWSPHKKRNMCLQLSESVGVKNIELEVRYGATYNKLLLFAAIAAGTAYTAFRLPQSKAL